MLINIRTILRYSLPEMFLYPYKTRQNMTLEKTLDKITIYNGPQGFCQTDKRSNPFFFVLESIQELQGVYLSMHLPYNYVDQKGVECAPNMPGATKKVHDLLYQPNFEKEMVLTVFSGERPNGLYSVTIENIVETDTTLRVLARENKRKSGSMLLARASYPAHLVAVPIVNKKIDFQYVGL